MTGTLVGHDGCEEVNIKLMPIVSDEAQTRDSVTYQGRPEGVEDGVDHRR
jgi:hypothetical protein